MIWTRQTQEEKDQTKKIQKAKATHRKWANSLSWVDLSEVREDGLILKKGKKEEVVRGIKVIPSNLFLEEEDMQIFKISLYRQALNNLNFPIYHEMVFNPIDVRAYMKRLNLQLSNSTLNEYQKLLVQESINKMELFCANNKEMEFFLMVKGKNDKHFGKRYNDLVRFFKSANFQIAELDAMDYRNYLSNLFENELVNDFYFAQGHFEILSHEYQLNEQINNELLLFDSDESYQVLDSNMEVILEFTDEEEIDLLNILQGQPGIYLLCSCTQLNPNNKRVHYKFAINSKGQLLIQPKNRKEQV